MRLDFSKVFFGISGLALPTPKALYPPEFQDKSRLEYYASLFNSLEVNSSFYKLPLVSTIKKWTDLVPENFKFTFKLSKTITHIKGLEFNEDDIGPFMKAIAPAVHKQGSILIQFPPSLTVDKLDKLQALLSTLDFYNADNWKFAVEFRNPSWYESEVYEILEEYNVGMVFLDIPSSASLQVSRATSDIVYIRLHGPEPRYRGSYSEEQLTDIAEKIRFWAKKDKTIYCYFNNTMGSAVSNLQTLISLCK